MRVQSENVANESTHLRQEGGNSCSCPLVPLALHLISSEKKIKMNNFVMNEMNNTKSVFVKFVFSERKV